MNDPFSTTHPAPGSSTRQVVESAKAHAVQAAEELRAAAGVKAQEFRSAAEEKASQLRDAAEERAGHLRDLAENGWADAKVKAQDLISETEHYVRENPSKSILTALGVGFVLGLLFRR